MGYLAAFSQTLPVWADTVPTAPEEDVTGVAAPSDGTTGVEIDPSSCSSSLTISGISCPETIESNPMAQVRSVAELSDVRSTDWAYKALQALAERYGVITGYPDRTFRGNQPITRYEFAAVLKQMIVRVEERLSTAELNQLREDFATLRRLQATYGAIAADLQTRLDQLDTELTKLTNQQFSTVSKLSGQTVLALTDGTDAKPTSLARVRLNLNTSLSPGTVLLTQLEAGNNGSDAIDRAHNQQQNVLGTTGLLANGGGTDYVGVSSNVRVSKLYYSFRPLPDVSVTVGARLSPGDFIDYNRFANNPTVTFSPANFASSFFTNNPLIVQNQVERPGGAGVVLTWKPEALPLTLRALYVAADAERPSAGLTDGGLFGDRQQGSVELQYDFSKDLAVRLQYTQARINNTDISAGGMNAEWAINRQFGVFGRLGFGRYEGFNPLLNRDLDLRPWTWSVGFIARRIVVPGSTAGVAIGQPFVENDLGTATQTNVEAFYSFLLNDNISFTPAILVVTNPNNDRREGTIWQWMIRMVFSF